MPKKIDSTIEAAKITSRRGMIAVILAAFVTATGGFLAYNYGKIFSNPQTFTGRAIDAKTEAKLRGVKVSLEGDAVPAVAFTDSEGVFSFPLADANKEIRLRLEQAEYQNFDLRITPAKNQGIQDVRMSPLTETVKSRLTGYVFDQKDKPLAGAKVAIRELPEFPAAETTTDGAFWLNNIPRKKGEMVRLDVTKEGYEPTNEYVLLSNQKDFKLKKRK